MKIIRLFFLSFFILTMVNAQTTNLIENGSFEQTRTHLGQTKFEGWVFHRNLSVQKVSGFKGSNAAKVYMNNLSFSVSKSGNYNIIDVSGGATYKLSFWIKGENGVETIEPIITWYDSNGNKLNGGRAYLGSQSSLTSWKEKTIEITAPSVAKSANLSFRVSNSGNSLTIDEVSLIKTGVGASVSVPSGLQVISYQREMEVSWHRGKPNTTFEVVFDGASTVVSTNKFIVTGLLPNTNHTVKVRSIVGAEKSDFTNEQSKSTKSFVKTKDDPMRVPHLRTLTLEGKPNQTINLFYSDLYNANAIINFYIDNQQVLPINDTFKFPKKGKQVLKMIINEGSGYEWETTYNFDVE